MAKRALRVDLHELAQELMTAEGIANYRADLLTRCRQGGNREKFAQICEERKIINDFEAANRLREEQAVSSELVAELRETQRLMKATIGAETSFDTAPPLPQESGRGAHERH